MAISSVYLSSYTRSFISPNTGSTYITVFTVKPWLLHNGKHFYESQRKPITAAINPHIPTLFTPVGNHREGVKLPPGVSPFLWHVRKKLQRLHPCTGGKIFLRSKPLCPEVACTGSRYRGSRNQKLQHLWPQTSYVRNSDVCLQAMPALCMPRRCLSVCPPSHAGIVSKRMKIRSCGFHHQVGQSSKFLER